MLLAYFAVLLRKECGFMSTDGNGAADCEIALTSSALIRRICQMLVDTEMEVMSSLAPSMGYK